MRFNLDPSLPALTSQDYLKQLNARLYWLFRNFAQQLNGISEGSITAKTNADTAAPTAGTYYQGDYVTNKTPTEQGTSGSKYVILGWVCVASGTPGTWVQHRGLTGN